MAEKFTDVMAENLYFNGPSAAFTRSAALIAANLTDIDPAYSSSCMPMINTNSVSFGDGYEQRSPNGINNVKLVFNLVFSHRSLTVVREIKKFLMGDRVNYNRAVDDYFYWSPLAPYDVDDRGVTQYLKFKCNKQQEIVFDTFNSYTFSATFEQVFDL